VKRVLQALALVQILLVLGLGARIVTVMTTPLPEFGAIPELPAPQPLPPPKPIARISESTTEQIVAHDLFDDQRGQGVTEEETAVVPETPIPPPSNVKLMGVLVLGRDPVAILQDTSVSPEQKSVRKGDMFGEYQIGEIVPTGLTLLGNAGQQFQIPLHIEATAGGVPAGAAVPHPAAAGAPSTRPQPPAAGKPVTAKPVPPQRPDAAEAEPKAMSARERAQAIAQRNAELRKNNQKGGAAGGEKDNKPDPVQARLEALRQLREAAKSH